MTEFVTLVSDHLQARAISPSFVRKVLNDSLGQERAEEMLDRIGGPSASQHFKFVIGRDPTQMAAMLADEHPQAIALILSKLPPADAMDLLGRLPNTLQGDVAFRMATMSPPTLEIIRQVEESFRRRLAATPTPKKAPERNGDQLQALLEVLKRATPETEEAILSQLDSVDPALAQELRDRMFTFDDLQSIDNKGIQALLREVDTRTLALALKGAKTATADRIYENLSERASTNLAEEVELLGRQPRSEVEEARTTIVKSVRNLQESGVIGLSRGSDDYVE
jgi:flagellar motor switch protein FliG